MGVDSFKDTDVGRIPVDWDFGKLQDHLIIKGRIGWKGLKDSRDRARKGEIANYRYENDIH